MTKSPNHSRALANYTDSIGALHDLDAVRQRTRTWRSIALAALLALTFAATASASPPNDRSVRQAFAGRFVGVGDATGAVLALQQSGSHVLGQLVVDGASYAVRAHTSGGSARGVIVDPGSGASQPCRIDLDGRTAILALPQSANGLSSFRFQPLGPVADPRVAGRSDGSGSSVQGQPVGGGTAAGGAHPRRAPGGQLDPRLLGHWRHTEVMTSAGASFVSDQHLVVRADGTFTHADGGAAAGDANVSIVSGGRGGESGRWRVRGKLIEVSLGGPFRPFARYHVEGNSLMFVFGDGSKQVWNRLAQPR